MKRLLFLTGHYGSGKSEVAVNLALMMKPDMLIDLDILNPYFRSREREELLKENGIQTIGSTRSNSLGSDLPYISPAAYVPIYNKEMNAIYDIGGDPAGAKVIRQYEQKLTDIDYDMYIVVNVYRPMTDSKEKIINMISQIEGQSGLKVTGIINNSNFVRETKQEDITYGQQIVEAVSEEVALPIIYTTIWDKLDSSDIENEINNDILRIKLYLREKWL